MRRWWTPEEDAVVTSMPDAVASATLARSISAVKQRRWKLTTGRASHGPPTGRPANVLEDVWKYVDRGHPDDCWPWTGATRRRGYGIFTVARKSYVAHRLVFQVANGIDPGALLVCHRCDNPRCCNPGHLFLGTPTDNVRDMFEKGRAKPPRGTTHWNAKLDEATVRVIRERHAGGAKVIALSREYGISNGQISNIVNHKAWSHA